MVPWSWRELSSNIYIDIDDIMNHLDLPWEWLGVTARLDVTSKLILANPTLPWCERMLEMIHQIAPSEWERIKAANSIVRE